MSINESILSFNSGILSPKIDVRVDVEKYRSGCRRLENMIPEKYGCATKRPGFIFIYDATNAPSSAPSEPIVFFPTPDGALTIFESTTFLCQTFLTGGAYTVAGVKLYAYRESTPGDLTVSIRATDGGEPTGDDLTSGVLNVNDIFEYPDFEEITITFSSPLLLSANTLYALVIKTLDVTGTEFLSVGVKITTELYADGQSGYSSNSGTSWDEMLTTQDICFETVV